MNLPTVALRNVGRNPTRLAMTMAGVAIALLTFVTLHTCVRSWDEAQDVARQDRLVTRHKITFVLTLPIRYITEVRNLRGADGQPLLRASTFMCWFGGKDPNHENEFFGTLAVDQDSFFDVYDEIVLDDAARQAFASQRDAAIVGVLLAEKFGWHVGDRVTLESPIYPAPEGRPWTFDIVGIYDTSSKAVDRQTLYFRYDYMNDGIPEGMRDQIGWISSRSANPAAALEAASAIDALFADRDTQTLSQDERTFFTSFVGMVGSVLKIMSMLSYIILTILGLILANTISMSVRERTSEYAAMKAMGFTGRHVASLILGESIMTALLGAIPGVILSYVIVDMLMGDFFEANLAQFFPIFTVHPTTLAMAGGLTLLIGLVSGLAPAISAAQLRVVENLRRVA
ncbi:MAG: FtsX-like permease family protein [Myxococcales bacterium]|nr:FtsX-like permease family protein [Myxococcales bacterium]MCB9534136.1 FtsX-like permease family protein [Myxococcales bacterium]